MTATASAANLTATASAVNLTNTAAALTTGPTTVPKQSVVISEFRTRGLNGSNDEFIELYNPTSNWIEISGWRIFASNNSGNTSARATIPGSTILRPGQHYLITNNNASGPYSIAGVPGNLTYGTGIADKGGIALVRADSKTIVDRVGMDPGSAYKEGQILAPFTTDIDQSYERKQNGCQDTNDNAVDFLLRDQTNGGSNPHNYSSDFVYCDGTTIKQQLITTTTSIYTDSPDPSLPDQKVTVKVRVTGSSPTWKGDKVNVTGATNDCSITLSAAGTGSCLVRFTQTGFKIITAKFLGDTRHAGSSDIEYHQVSSIAYTPIPTRPPTPRPPPPLVGINEFVPRPGHDWNNDGVVNVGDEYIELLNHGVVDVNLSGYSLDDEVNVGSSPYRLPSVILKPGERHVFYGSETGLLLGDGGDGVRLLKPNGQLADAYNYTVARYPDESYCRLPDNGGLDDWNQYCFPTPGLQNSLNGAAPIPPQGNQGETLCPIADTLPRDFVLAECPPFGNNIWNSAYWDKFGWFDEKTLPEGPGKWPLFAQ
ncbi:MAG TPA: lamin tail domain-containing protein [Anaerolineales bacterium]|nr:lamin tail domain-containing protein [Anaerolineales bacterium]